MGPRQFISVQFDDRFWERILKRGYRVFVLYEIDGEERWTKTVTFHATAWLAHMEVMEIMLEGIKDADDGFQNDVKRIVIFRFPVDDGRREDVVQ